MISTQHDGTPTMTPPPAGLRPAPARARRRWASYLAGSQPDRLTLAGLFLFATLVGVAMQVFPSVVAISTIVLPLVMGSLFLGPRPLPWFVVYNMFLLTLALPKVPNLNSRTVFGVGVIFLVAFIIMLTSFRRSRLGIAGSMGESMLAELSDRIQGQGVLPDLPAPWHAESVIRSAGGTRFAGDFFVVGDIQTGRLDVTVVDVSGKGDRAGTRALQLSGAFGGMLGAVSPAMFLASANDYLLRQDWSEGFATAIHLSLWLDTGEFEVRSAGHPPAVLRHAGSGRWSVLQSSGAVLGLLPYAEFTTARGTLERGDALMLYTDGMVEEPQRDLELGLDKMLGQAEGLLRGGVVGSADRLVEALGSRDDDRAMVVVHRQ